MSIRSPYDSQLEEKLGIRHATDEVLASFIINNPQLSNEQIIVLLALNSSTLTQDSLYGEYQLETEYERLRELINTFAKHIKESHDDWVQLGDYFPGVDESTKKAIVFKELRRYIAAQTHILMEIFGKAIDPKDSKLLISAFKELLARALIKPSKDLYQTEQLIKKINENSREKYRSATPEQQERDFAIVIQDQSKEEIDVEFAMEMGIDPEATDYDDFLRRYGDDIPLDLAAFAQSIVDEQ
jgi:hypothetical protein